MSTEQVVERIDVHHGNLFFQEHLIRYKFATEILPPGATLDIACGNGYGTNLLGQTLDSPVIGVDIHHPTLNQANQNYQSKTSHFITSSGTDLPFKNGYFQNIVSLETIEHIENDSGFLSELSRVLHPKGICIISTPNRENSIRHRKFNPYHVREYGKDEFLELLSKFFAKVDLFYQGFNAQYHNQMRSYAESIQNQKTALNPLIQFAINHPYRVLKQKIPPRITNLLIQRLLGLSLPNPDPDDLVISPHPLEDPIVFIVICQSPISPRTDTNLYSGKGWNY